jgi:ABC-type antimicrobial peptide transport system permease subunit
VIAFLVAQREREIGVRIALGATRSNILKLVVGRSLRLLASGAIGGMVAAFALSHLLRSMLYNIGPRDPLSYALVIAMLGATGVAASLLPARAAAQVDPATVLRSE